MEIADVKKHIKSGNLEKVYIFYGEEYQIIKMYLKMMAARDMEIVYVDSLTDLMTGVRTKTLIQNRHLYVVFNDKEYLTNEEMWERFTGLKDDVVVFYYTNADKRLKFWKQNADRAVEFAQLDDQVLTKYIQKILPLSNESCNTLIDVCDHSYGRILLELDKVKSYADGVAKITGRPKDLNIDGVLETLLDTGVIYREPKDAIFDFVAAVLERKPSKAYDLLQQSKAVGEANMVLISVLYTNIKTLLQVQSASDYRQLGLSGFAIKNVAPYKNYYTNGELVHAMRLLREIEKGIKTGEVPDELSVEYFLVQVM